MTQRVTTKVLETPAIRLLTRMYASTPLGNAREGFIVSEDGGSVYVVEGRAFDENSDYRRPYGADRTGFSTLSDAVEYANRRGWNSAALVLWSSDYAAGK